MFIISKCIITFPSFQKTKQNKQIKQQQQQQQQQQKKHQIFILDSYLMGYLFRFDWGCCQHAIY